MKRAHTSLLILVAGMGLLLIAVGTLVSSGVSHAAPVPIIVDEGEPNNSHDEATSVNLADTVSGLAVNTPITDTDFFVVGTTTGLSYRAEFQIASGSVLLLKLVIYDQNKAYLTSSSSSSSSTNISWTAYGDRYYVEVQPSGPVTATVLSSSYTLDIWQLAATPTSTPQPTSTPTPSATPTTVPGATLIPGADKFEPNYDFDHAATVGTDITYDANFIPWGGYGPDNDYYKTWIKPGLHFTCETLDLAPGVDTNMILYDGNHNGIGGNDDVELGDYRSRLSYFSTYEGWLYILVGHGGRLPPSELSDSDYSLICDKQAPGLPTATSTPKPTSTPLPTNTPSPNDSPTPTPPVSPVSSPTPAQGLTVRTLATPTGVSVPATVPSGPRFVPISVLVYYDGNDDGRPGAGEGIAGISAQAYEVATNQLLAQGFTDDRGSLEFAVAALGHVRVSFPFFGFSQLVASEGASIYLRVPAQPFEQRSPSDD